MHRFLAAALLVLTTPAPAALLELAWDNDILFGKDGTYTNGVRLGWLSDDYRPAECLHCLPHLTSRMLDFLPGITADAEHSIGVYVQQTMLTPEDLSVAQPQYNDVPYAGVLRANISLHARRTDAITRYGLSLGVIGPNSGAESMQVRIHKLTNSQVPKGWDNQLGEKTLAGINFGHVRRHQRRTLASGRQLEWGSGAVADLDNFYSVVRAGSFLRYGRNLPGNLLPDYASIGSSVSLSGLFAHGGRGWAVFGGFAAEGVTYNYFDHNADGYRIEQSPVLGALIVGAEAYSPGFHIALSLRETTTAVKNARRPLRFGTLSLVWKR